MMDRDNLALARHMSQEMESDGTWVRLRREVARQFPDRNSERRFLVVRADGVPAPALMLRSEPWTEEAADNWMAYLWESQRVGGFSVQVSPGGESGGKQRVSVMLSGDPKSKHPLSVSLAFIVDVESGRFFRGALERRPQEAAALAVQHYAAVMFPPGAVDLGEFSDLEPEEEG